MRISLSIGGALLALTAFASTADARMGSGMGMSSSMSHGAGHGSMGSPRGFSPDGRTFSPDGFTARVKGSHWKHPIDSDNGGPDDPPKKTPKGSTQTGSNGNGPPKDCHGNWHCLHPGQWPPKEGYVDPWGHYHPPR